VRRLVLIGIAAALVAAGCDSDEAAPHRAARRSPPPADAAHGPFEVDFTADDHAVLYLDGNREGEYTDGPALREALLRVRRDQPATAEHLTFRLPMVFGKRLRGDYAQALEDAGYVGLFGMPIRSHDARPTSSPVTSPKPP
jgi:hypothetical protein